MTARYTRELLEEAARVAETIDDAVIHCGGTPTPGSRRYLRRKLAEAGLPVPRPGARWARHTESRLREAVAASSSLNEVLRHLGINRVGGNQTHIARRIAAYGIDTGHFTGRAHARGKASPRRLPAERILRRRDDGRRRTKSALLRRALDEIGVPRLCAECGLGDVWQGRPLVLEIDHVNGDHLDNRPDNLRYLCPSCHSQTPTFSRRAAGRGAAGDPVQ